MRSGVTVVGSYNVGLFCRGDRLPGSGETVIGGSFWEGGGGKGSNQAVAASKFGAATSFVARLGDDNYGAAALAMYRRFGIATDRIRIDPGAHTGISLILIDRNGSNLIMVVPGANYRLCEEDIEAAEDAFAACGIAGFQLENRLEIVEYGLRKARQAGARTLLDPGPAVALPEDLYPLIDYIKPNETEAATLTGIPVRDVASAAEAGRRLIRLGTGAAIVTLGEAGAVLITGDRVEHFPAPRVEAVDSTGAGDIFCGALMAALAGNRPIEDAIAFANQAAALSVTCFGVIEAIPDL